ncbi:WD40 repeat domain-containing protein [Chloropicon primus]|uniref:Serine-threonine kinase receptor-associated protein n=1 Tax=Chloropicon primus TaxID=1764295 RepID=A0A5B8N0U2_9CHLO|nr:WD40 repeat domain-containing protein [Chloropicon primus]UPR05072.1 WD40 repeat domain-containing protein [Chloropicon primus]|eukprot:QDZ25876.1 WD40 repeat domain-containing protein [Chloropicon primus]
MVCHGHSRPIVDLQYSPVTKDGVFIVSASKDGKPMLRNGTTGDWIGTFEGHKGAVWSACLNAPATLAATGSADFTAKVWDGLTGDQVYEFGHKHIVRCVSFSPDSAKLCTGGFEKQLRIYDLTKPEADPVSLPKQSSAVKCAKWSTENENLIYTSLAGEGGVAVWDVRDTTSKAAFCFDTGKDVVTSIELSSRDVVTTASGNQVSFWKAETGDKVKDSCTIPFTVESASLCEEKGYFAAGGEDMWVHLYDYKTGKEIAQNKGHHGPVHCVRFAPGGDSYASGSEDGTIRIWSTPSSEPSGSEVSAGTTAASAEAEGSEESS